MRLPIPIPIPTPTSGSEVGGLGSGVGIFGAALRDNAAHLDEQLVEPGIMRQFGVE